MAKVMLVEDDNNLREIYEARLAAEGYEIVSAPDGEAALALAIKEKPDLIISDIMMPKVSGFDMLDILRSTTETKNAKIIMMTALNQAEDKARAEQLGADMYLVKSQVTLEDVVKAAQKMLGNQTPSSVGGIEVEQPATPAPTAPATSLTSNVPGVPVVAAPTPATPTPQTPPAPVAPAAPTPPPTPAPAQTIPVTTPAPAPTAAPVAPAPTPAAQAAPATAPADSPAMPPIPQSATTAEEEAALQAQIEQFITSNPTISTTAGDETPPAPVAAPPSTPSVPAPTPPGSPVAQTPSVSPQPVQVPVQSVPETTTLPEDAPAGEQRIAKNPESDTTSTEPGIDASVSGRKKVIQPISDVLSKGPDLSALLAKEGEVVGQPAAPSANSVITPDGVTMPSAMQDVIPSQQGQTPPSTQPPQTPSQPAA